LDALAIGDVIRHSLAHTIAALNDLRLMKLIQKKDSNK